MPLRWKLRYVDCGSHSRDSQLFHTSSDFWQASDVSDVVLLPRRPCVSASAPWAGRADRDALTDALVDTLLSQPRSRPRPRRRSASSDVLHRAMSGLPDDLPDDGRPPRASVETLFLRTSWDDLCRRSTRFDGDVAAADSAAAAVGSGRLRRQNALGGRVSGRVHNRWRGREDHLDGLGTLGNDQGTGPAEIVKRLPRPSQQRVSLYDDPLNRPPRRATRARPRFCRELCRDLLDTETTASADKLTGSHHSLALDNDHADAAPPQTPKETPSAASMPNPDNPLQDQTQEEDVEDVIRNQLECPVCLDYLSPPIKQCLNGHCVCSCCSPRLSQCATCRASFISTSNIVLENLVRSLFFPCRYRDAGCTQVFKMEQRPCHEQVCLYRPRRCPMACCDWQGLPGHLKAHVTTHHLHHTLALDELRDFSFCVDRNDGAGVPTIVHDEQFVIFVQDEIFVFESHYDLWRSKFFAELRRFDGDVDADPGKAVPGCQLRAYAYDVELYTASKNGHLKVRNLVDDEERRTPTAIKIDLDVFNRFVTNGCYTLHLRILLVKEDGR